MFFRARPWALEQACKGSQLVTAWRCEQNGMNWIRAIEPAEWPYNGGISCEISTGLRAHPP